MEGGRKVYVRGGWGLPQCWLPYGYSVWCKCLRWRGEWLRWSFQPFSPLAASRGPSGESRGGGRWRRCWAFFMVELVFRDQVKFSARWTPRNFVFFTISTGEPWMFSDSWSLCGLQKSTTISVVLSYIRLLTLHQVISCSTSSLYVDPSFLSMRPTTVVLSANLMMWFESCSAVQSWVRTVNSNGLSTKPLGASVLSVVVLEVLFPIRTVWGLPVRKSRIQLQRDVFRPSKLSFLVKVLGDDCVKCWTEVYEQHSDISVLLIQMGDCLVEVGGDGIGGVVDLICELQESSVGGSLCTSGSVSQSTSWW